MEKPVSLGPYVKLKDAVNLTSWREQRNTGRPSMANPLLLIFSDAYIKQTGLIFTQLVKMWQLVSGVPV